MIDSFIVTKQKTEYHGNKQFIVIKQKTEYNDNKQFFL